MRRQLIRLLHLAAAAVPVMATAAMVLSPAGATPAFSGVAAAEGIRITFGATGGPVTNTPLDGGSPVAQAALDSLGSSTAFASHLYPGDAAVAGPGTVSGFSNGAVNLPSYPFIAQSDAATNPESNVSGAGASLRARSSADRSEALAATGGFDSASASFVSATAVALVGRSGAGPRAVSSSDLAGFAAGPLVLGHVHSVADVAIAEGGSVTRRSELTVTGASIAGTAVEMGPQGVMLGPSASPLPGTPVEDQLRQAGITLSYLAPEESEGGVTAAGLVVTVQHAVPGPVTPVAVKYLLGRASARLGNASASSSIPAAAEQADEPAAPPPAAVPTAAPEPSAAADPSLIAPTPLPTLRNDGGSLPPAPSDPSSSPIAIETGTGEVPGPATTGRPPVMAAPVATTRAVGLFDTRSFYLVVAAGGVLAAATVRIIGQVGR